MLLTTKSTREAEGENKGGGGRKTHDDEHRDISFGVRSREFAASKTSKRPLRVTGCPAACDTVPALCIILPRDRENERVSKGGRVGSRRQKNDDDNDDEEEEEEEKAESLPLSEVLEFVPGLSAGKYDVSHLLN